MKKVTRKSLIALAMEREGYLPRCGYERHMMRRLESDGLTCDYWLENVGGYVKVRTFRFMSFV